MPDLSHVVFLLIIAYWAPQISQPVEVQHAVFSSPDECGAEALRRDAEWTKKVHGGSTSYACFAAVPGPST